MPDAAPRHRHLTPQMRAALKAARSQPLRRVHKPGPGQPPWPAHHSTLSALVTGRGFLRRIERRSRNEHLVEEWWITELGLDALTPPSVTRCPRPLLIAEGWPDFTRDPSRALRGEPGVLPDDEPAWLIEAA